jgi:cytochrome b561
MFMLVSAYGDRVAFAFYLHHTRLEFVAHMSPTANRFSVTQRVLHWSVALLVFFNLLFPDGMNAWRHITRNGGIASTTEISAANIHAYVGIAILVLAVARLVLRATQGVPPEVPEEPWPFRVAARIAHFALYFLLFAMPMSGMAAYYFGFESLGSLHADLLKVILWCLIGAHVAGALVHQFYWRTNVLRRMTIG